MFTHNLAPAEAFHLPVLSLQSSVCRDEPIRRRERSTKINHRVFPSNSDMEAANKEAAEECLSKAQAAFRKGSFKEALRLAEKSSRMCRTKEADGENVKL